MSDLTPQICVEPSERLCAFALLNPPPVSWYTARDIGAPPPAPDGEVTQITMAGYVFISHSSQDDPFVAERAGAA
jgi:hypothetical protein